jgi:hypothetical protein
MWRDVADHFLAVAVYSGEGKFSDWRLGLADHKPLDEYEPIAWHPAKEDAMKLPPSPNF